MYLVIILEKNLIVFWLTNYRVITKDGRIDTHNYLAKSLVDKCLNIDEIF